MIKQFSLEDFHNTLADGLDTLGYRPVPVNVGDPCYTNEYNFRVVVSLFPKGTVCVMANSSIRRGQDVADAAGENSIRVWLCDMDGKPLGSKVGRWVTRQPGWRERLIEKVGFLVAMAEKVQPCPQCGDLMKVFIVNKDGPNKGRIFTKCNLHGNFRWLTTQGSTEFLDDEATVPEPELNPESCPKCGSKMILRKRRSDGSPFWGCNQYPRCTGTRNISSKPASQPTGDPQDLMKAAFRNSKTSGDQPTFQPSPEQQAIFEAVSGGVGNLVVEAGAGCAKTTTIRLASAELPRDKKIGFCAFNKAIAKELARVAPAHVTVRTVHSFGFFAIRQAYRNVKVDEDKVGKILKDKVLDRFTQMHLFSPIMRLVSLCKGNLMEPTLQNLEWLCDRYGLEVNGDADVIFAAARVAYDMSLKMADKVIDYDDMIFIPVVSQLAVEKFDILFVDEAQDMNKCQIRFLLSSVKEGGRIIAVGDRNQSLYGFRGADTDAIPNIIEATQASTLTLSTTFRCPKSHVQLINELFPNIPFTAPEWAQDGVIREVSNNRFEIEVQSGDMVLCRTNAPLVGPAFALIRRGVKATIRGRDIGKGLLTLIRKMNTDDLGELMGLLKDYRDAEVYKLMKADKNNQAQAIEDKIDTIVALADGVNTIMELENRIEAVFSDETEGVVFSSVHRAKGLEATRVYILRNDLMPHPMASKDWEQVQEANCQYVAYTRSKSELVFVQQ